MIFEIFKKQKVAPVKPKSPLRKLVKQMREVHPGLWVAVDDET